MHLSQRASWSSCKIFKPCLKMFERAEPHPTSSNPQCRAQGRLKTPEVVCFPCLCDVMKFMDILPIEIWISKWSNLFVGKTSKSARTSAIKQGVGCWSSELSTFTRPTSGIFKSISLLCLQTSYPKPKVQLMSKKRSFVSCHIYYPMIAHHPSFPNHEWDLMAGWQQTNKKGVMVRLSLYTLEWYMYPNIPQPPLGWFWCFGNMPSSFSANSMGSAVGSFATSPTNFRKFCPAPWLCLRRGLGGLIIDGSSGCQCWVFLHICADWASALEVSPISRCLVSGLDTWYQMKANLFMRNCCREVIIWQWTAQFVFADSSKSFQHHPNF